MPKQKSSTETDDPDKKKMLITLETKYFIINESKAGVPPTEIAKKFGISRRTVYTILRRKDKYLNDMKQSGSIQPSFGKAQISTLIPEMERVVDSWIKDHTHRLHMPVTYDSICEKAMAVFKALRASKGSSRETFTPSKHWFERFRRRTGWHDINIRGAEYADIGDFIKQLDEVIQKQGYHYSQIFNVSETSLYWKLLPPTEYIPDDEFSMTDFKAAKDRVTLLLGGNALGDYKLKPILVHDEENPKELEGADKSSLPVVWKHNEKPWITTKLFEEWLINDFLSDVKKYTDAKNIPFHILLVVENSIGHLPGLQNFRHPNVKLMFMPPNAKSLLEPIIATFKAHYLRLALDTYIKTRDSGSDSFEKYAKSFTILNAVKLIETSWNRIIKNDMISVWNLIFPKYEVKVDVQPDPEGYSKDELEAVVNIAEQLEIEISQLVADDNAESQELQKSQISQGEPMVEVKCELDDTFTLEALNKAFQHLNSAIEIFNTIDPDSTRSGMVADSIEKACDFYYKKFTEKKREAGIKEKVDTDTNTATNSAKTTFPIKEEFDLGEYSV